MDALSDVLRAVRLTGAIFFDIHAAEPWVAVTPAAASIVGRVLPGVEHLVPYHIVARGACWAGVSGDEPVHLSEGDIIVFPHGEAHTMSSAPGMQGEADLARYRRPDDGQLPFVLSMGTGGPESVEIVCGYLGCDAGPFNPLLAALPPVFRVGGGGTTGTIASLAVAESRKPRIGGERVLGLLSELLFVDAVRRYLETLPPDRTGWLGGLRDPFVGRALTSLHADPSRDWSLESLARGAGLSRSALAERFTQFVGLPPMQYLANWRMQLAANRLRSGTESVAEIAARVGYQSEAAFSRAFKRTAGRPPSDWRREARASAPATPVAAPART